MDVKIKICGLMREEDVRCVNELKPDLIGFVFVEGRRRFVTPDWAAHLRSLLDPAINAVGVFVNEKPEQVAALLNRGVIDMAQLHGQEDEGYLTKLREMTDRPLIQAFRVDSPEDVKRAESSGADYILLDHGIGGTGEKFDWSLLTGIKRPFLLAGGLNEGNVTRALELACPWGLDVSSGVETDGKKDPRKMERFVEAVRKYESPGEK